MVQVLKKSKQEVEASLKQRTSSIANRLEKLESALPIAPERIRRLTDKKTLIKAGASIAAGIVVGMIVLRFRRDPNRAFRQELDHVTDSIGKEIRRNLQKGLDEEAAVSKALNKRPPVLNLGSDAGSFWSSLLTQLSRHVASALGPVIAEKIADRFKSSSDEK